MRQRILPRIMTVRETILSRIYTDRYIIPMSYNGRYVRHRYRTKMAVTQGPRIFLLWPLSEVCVDGLYKYTIDKYENPLKFKNLMFYKIDTW